MDSNEERWRVEPTRCENSGWRRFEGGTAEVADLAGGVPALHLAVRRTGGMGRPRAPEGQPRARASSASCACAAAGELLLACALPWAVWAAIGGCG
jgi:hypothetical protein